MSVEDLDLDVGGVLLLLFIVCRALRVLMGLMLVLFYADGAVGVPTPSGPLNGVDLAKEVIVEADHARFDLSVFILKRVVKFVHLPGVKEVNVFKISLVHLIVVF